MNLGVNQATTDGINAARRDDVALHVLSAVDSDAYSSHPGDEYAHEFWGI